MTSFESTAAPSEPSGSRLPAGRQRRRLAIVISTGPARGELTLAAALAHAARAVGVDVQLFLMHRGVASAAADRDAIERLAHDGCDIIACASSAQELAVQGLPSDVVLGSQDDHAAMVRRADRLVAFT